MHACLTMITGARVSDTIRKGIIDPMLYENNTELLMVGNVATLSGTSSSLHILKLTYDMLIKLSSDIVFHC